MYKLRDRDGRPIPKNPRNDLVLKRWWENADQEAMREALSDAHMAGEEKAGFLLECLDKPPFPNVTFQTCVRKLGITHTQLEKWYTDYQLTKGRVRMATHAPDIMEGVALDAKGRTEPCAKCKGRGSIPREDGKAGRPPRCPDCGGTGVNVLPADPEARKLYFEAMKLTGKGPLVAQQFNFDGTFNVDAMIARTQKDIEDR